MSLIYKSTDISLNRIKIRDTVCFAPSSGILLFRSHENVYRDGHAYVLTQKDNIKTNNITIAALSNVLLRNGYVSIPYDIDSCNQADINTKLRLNTSEEQSFLSLVPADIRYGLLTKYVQKNKYIYAEWNMFEEFEIYESNINGDKLVSIAKYNESTKYNELIIYGDNKIFFFVKLILYNGDILPQIVSFDLENHFIHYKLGLTIDSTLNLLRNLGPYTLDAVYNSGTIMLYVDRYGKGNKVYYYVIRDEQWYHYTAGGAEITHVFPFGTYNYIITEVDSDILALDMNRFKAHIVYTYIKAPNELSVPDIKNNMRFTSATDNRYTCIARVPSLDNIAIGSSSTLVFVFISGVFHRYDIDVSHGMIYYDKTGKLTGNMQFYIIAKEYSRHYGGVIDRVLYSFDPSNGGYKRMREKPLPDNVFYLI